jgi:hypothetical protein
MTKEKTETHFFSRSRTPSETHMAARWLDDNAMAAAKSPLEAFSRVRHPVLHDRSHPFVLDLVTSNH